MEVHHQQSRGVKVFRGKSEDQFRQNVTLLFLITDMGRCDEIFMQGICEERVGQITKVRLEDRGHTADIIEPVRVSEIEGVIVASLE